MDAGWFNVDHPECGDWRVNLTKFPRGLEPIAESIRDHGMTMGLWFDAERVTQKAFNAFPRRDLLKRAYRVLPSGDLEEADAWLVDLSMPAAQEWMTDLIAGHAERLNLGWIRWDLNFPPLGMWLHDARDNPDRVGWKEIKYVEGLYATLDRLRQRCPDLLIEWCGGGGRRIDLESLRRSHTLWRSDITGEGEDIRAQLTGGSMWLPGNRLNANLIQIESPYDYYCQFGGPLGFGHPFSRNKPKRIAAATEMVQRFKEVRHLLLEDYYPLFQYSILTSGWDGWQFHDPRRNEGLVVVLRLQDSPFSEATVSFRALDRHANYRLTAPQASIPAELTGEELVKGIAIRLDKPQSAIFVKYWKVAPDRSESAEQRAN